MTYDQAVTIRTMQLNGKDISPVLTEEAIRVIQRTRTPTARPRTKGTRLSAEERAYAINQGQAAAPSGE